MGVEAIKWGTFYISDDFVFLTFGISFNIVFDKLM